MEETINEEKEEKIRHSKGVVNAAFATEENGISHSVSPPAARYQETFQHQESARADDDGGYCGWLFFKPKSLQTFKTSKWVLFCLCWGAAIQGMVINGFVNVCITTLEKRYNLRSTSTGIIAGSYDIGAVICSIPVSYLGSLPGASKPRWLGWGMLIMGIGSFVFALPHFTAPSSQLSLSGSTEDFSTNIMLCLLQKNTSSTCASAADNWLSNYQYVFIFGQFLHGVGASPLYTLGVAYLDESVQMKMSSFYLGIFHAMAVIGPAIGYVIGGQFLNVYIDSPNISPSIYGITRDSEQWLGAWWIGFMLSGVMAISISWIVMAFPAEIPGAKKRATERTGAEGHISAKAFAHIKHLPGAAAVLLKNLPFLFLSLAQASEGIIVSGFATFMPKVIENQFGLSAAFASLLVGFIAVPAGGGGTFLGGWLVKHFGLKCESILKVCTVLSFICFLCTAGFFVSCPEISFAGVNVDYTSRELGLRSPQLSSTCNVECSCENVGFDPVCGSNKVMYYSPCHAGCKSTSKSHNSVTQIFDDCKCVVDLPIENGTEALMVKTNKNLMPIDSSSSSKQKCPSTCFLLPVFIVFFFLLMTLTFLITMPSMSGTLRCVPDTHRSLALGLQGIQIRIFGTIPGPIIFGMVMDNACTLWQTTCEGTGSCRHYNNAVMSRSMTGVSLFFKIVSTLLFFLAWWFYRQKSRK